MDKNSKKTKPTGAHVESEKGNEDLDLPSEERGTKSCSATPKNGDRTSSLQRPATPKVPNEKGDKRNKDKEKHTHSEPSQEISKDGVDKDMGNVSSCVIDLKVVWFNFAAPPRAPITRKIDYTR